MVDTALMRLMTLLLSHCHLYEYTHSLPHSVSLYCSHDVCAPTQRSRQSQEHGLDTFGSKWNCLQMSPLAA